MRRILEIAKWGLALGNEPQTFLGAKWVGRMLGRAPESRKRLWALRVLSLSPHYFIDPSAPRYRGMRYDAYLEAVFDVCIESRVRIYEQVLKGRFDADDTVLEYGCGPGFFASVVSAHVKKLYACDISTGALACAKVLNNKPNVDYVVADHAGLASINDESVDAIFSYAVIQHLSDEAFEKVLQNCKKKLHPNGALILHIQLSDSVWKTETEWKTDTTLKGKLKYRYGLHCFGRTEEQHREMVARNGFENIEVTALTEFMPVNTEDIRNQCILTATRSSIN